MRSVIEVFQDGRWVPAAEFAPAGGGYRSTFEYLPEYVFGKKPTPVSLAMPVTMERQGIDGEAGAPPCPPFLLDLVPQGRGRQFLARELDIPDTDDADLLLTQHGAFNPIGNLRLDTAVRFYDDRRRSYPAGDGEGFTLDDIRLRRDAFLEHLWLHSMLSAGTTGVQGAAPKFLLTQDANRLWFADAALPDALAVKHWLIKLPRGSHSSDYAVLRNEAAYLRVAGRCGLRVEGEPMHENDMLFVPRFDRVVRADGLHRLAQETLASLAGIRGFGLPVSLFALVAGFRRHVTDPAGEILEFIRRDVLNLAMRNSDNHARNTSVQRLPDGRVQLTPVYDFAPMYLDRGMIVRGCRWTANDRRDITDLDEIIELLDLTESEKREVATGLRDLATTLADLPETMRECGVDESVIDDCKPNIEAQYERLDRISGHGQTP